MVLLVHCELLLIFADEDFQKIIPKNLNNKTLIFKIFITKWSESTQKNKKFKNMNRKKIKFSAKLLVIVQFFFFSSKQINTVGVLLFH